jgi:hypothetical protein
MKWMLVVMVFGITPVKTNLLFNNINDCLDAEDAMRAEYTRTFNTWQEWAQANPDEANPDIAFIRKRNGLESSGTCIPHAELPEGSN